ncbi:MAG TPA: kynureninase, partial [Candidatus Eisenbacteria bacterium]|nr:kynureninase [Candidatus Eisenbacteria bacterium]
LLPGRIYLDGNSLGLLSRDAETETLAALEQWKTLAIDGWLGADPPWFTLGEELGGLVAPLIGAEPEAVVVTGTTTVNQHALVATFYRPEGERRKIVATALDFPSDVYALQSLIRLHGGEPERDLVLVPSPDGRTIPEDEIVAALRDDVALALLPAVLYRSGQLLDVPGLATAARERGISLGFDCAHSIGAVPHRFDDWGVDWAFWCSYKFLNAGPGATGGLYVNRRHWGEIPGLAGWWGYEKSRQFDMLHTWEGATNAGAWQISTPPLLATAPLRGSLRLFHEAGIGELRTKSLAQTAYLARLLEEGGLTAPPHDFAVGTPRDPARRGGHLAVEHAEAARIARALKARGIIPDFRAPNVVRLAPVPLYTTYHELWQTAAALRAIVDNGEHLRMEAGRELVA